MAWREGNCPVCDHTHLVGDIACTKQTMCLCCFNDWQGNGPCGLGAGWNECGGCGCPTLFLVEECASMLWFEAAGYGLEWP
jgi:hypothetical protein